MSTELEKLNKELAELQDKIKQTENELIKSEIEFKNSHIKPLKIKLNKLYKDKNIPFVLEISTEKKTAEIFNTLKGPNVVHEYFKYQTINDLETFIKQQIFMTRIYNELFKNDITKNVSFLKEQSPKKLFAFGTKDYDFKLELNSNKKVKSLIVKKIDYASKVKIAFENLGLRLEITGTIYEDEFRRDYNASFDIALSCEKENFDLAELSSVIDELVEKLENAPKIEYLD